MPGSDVKSGLLTPTTNTFKGYSIPIYSIASASPSASTTYFFGGDSLSSTQTVWASACVTVPKSGIVKAAFLKASITTPGSAELCPHFVRVNDLTEVLFSNVPYNVNRQDIYGVNLNLAVNQGDTIAIKIATPAWSAAPASIRWEGSIYIE